jgi:hypothetical protein
MQKAGGPFNPGWWLQPGLKGSGKFLVELLKKAQFFLNFFEFPYF